MILVSEQAYDVIDGGTIIIIIGVMIIDGWIEFIIRWIVAIAVFVFYRAEHEAQELAAVMGNCAPATTEDLRHLCRCHSAAYQECHMPIVDTELTT